MTKFHLLDIERFWKQNQGISAKWARSFHSKCVWLILRHFISNVETDVCIKTDRTFPCVISNINVIVMSGGICHPNLPHNLPHYTSSYTTPSYFSYPDSPVQQGLDRMLRLYDQLYQFLCSVSLAFNICKKKNARREYPMLLENKYT